jgi:3-deoxy-D-manno-octulosonic-acid transferase
VSVGEVVAAGPVLRRLAADYPQRRLLLTTSTATGRRQALALYGRLADIRYLPYDLPGCVRRFLRRAQPQIGIILETEIWPTLYQACGRRDIPLVIASARLSERSVRRFQWARGLVRDVLSAPHVHVMAQSADDAARFIALGANPTRTGVCGNVKYDQMVDPAVLSAAGDLRRLLGSERPVWVAGSTHDGEEIAVLDAHRRVRAECPSALLVLAPRHPPRFEAVAQLLERSGMTYVRRTEHPSVTVETDVLLLDTLGELVRYYAAADLSFVGGSLVPIGGHNLLEPLSVRCAVLTGPSNSNDAPTARLLRAVGAIDVVSDAAELARAVTERFGNAAISRKAVDAGTTVLDANRGAVDRLCQTLRPLIDRSV